MTAAVLLALADRCEREEPSVDLYYQIEWAISDYVNNGGGYRTHKVTGKRERFDYGWPPRWLESIDAAVTIIPEGAEYGLGTLYGGAQAEVALNSDIPQLSRREDGNVPMTLCAAALRARAAMVEGGNGPGIA